jgi:GNAT superfamily N-acetyltransferase
VNTNERIKTEGVTKQNWHQLVKLFDGSNECSDCWCMNHRSDPQSCPTGEAAKKALEVEIVSERANGLLAFIDGTPVGWCAVDPALSQVGHDYCVRTKQCDPLVWMIHCLYVHPAHRGTGVSKVLIQAAIDLAKSKGATELLAFPIPEESAGKFPKDVAEFSGRFSTFKKFEFKIKSRLDDFYQVVSKRL